MCKDKRIQKKFNEKEVIIMKNTNFKKIIAVIISVICIVSCFSMMSCNAANSADFEGGINNIEATSASAKGDCTVRITGKDSAMGEAPVQFKSTISASDIKLEGIISGKKVKSVTYIDKETIDIVLTGNAKSFEGESDNSSMIRISSKATANDEASVCFVTVRNPMIVSRQLQQGSKGGKYSCTVSYEIYGGTFTESGIEKNVSISSGFKGTITSVTVKDGKLVVSIEDTERGVMLDVAAGATSFNRATSVGVTIGATAVFN